MRQDKTIKIRFARKGLLIAALLLLILGISRRGPADVKNKAVRICYECIGIG